ncbi:Putative anti-sigma factor antagonist BtrV [Pandoraea iniqua]|uniref:Anti-sigma factor antagonist n=1 Tax=Pandoraea iniqua TaxID=2508288 RepID=A0A5E4YGG0_9BURK|nr:STAS domain-containing protein [Pandoraea iniqua]VVE47916.1 Putative anti-sigma factor antagonist BtrV [Pandoraea iniqua]
MRLVTDIHESTVVIAMSGRLDGAAALEFERQVHDMLLQETGDRLILDFTALTYISSVGLRVLLGIGQALRARQGNMVLVGLDETVREVFEFSGFLTLFRCVDTVQIALADEANP